MPGSAPGTSAGAKRRLGALFAITNYVDITSMPQTAVFFLGNSAWPEFQAAVAAIERCADLTVARDVDAAAAAMEAGRTTPDLLVIAQVYPGEFSPDAVDRLRRLAPLAPVVGLLGSWCEGEMRSGQPWPGSARVYWHQWPARCRRELLRIAEGANSVWTLPATATDEERLLVEIEDRCKKSSRHAPHAVRHGTRSVPATMGVVVLVTRQRAMYEWLADALRPWCDATVWLHPARPAVVQGAAAVVLDGTDGCGNELEQIGDLAARFRPAPLVVLLDFPRFEDQQRVLAAGATAVLAKPLLVEDLLEEMKRAISPIEAAHGTAEHAERRMRR